MRNLLMISALALSAPIFSHASAAFAQSSTCGLRLVVAEGKAGDELKVGSVRGAQVVARRSGNRESIRPVVRGAQYQFPKLAEGEYRIIITKEGYQRVLQPIEFICFVPNQDALRVISIKRGSSTFTVVNQKLTVKAGLIMGRADAGAVETGPATGPDPHEATGGVAPTASSPATIDRGELNHIAISLPEPVYPSAKMRLSGKVKVEVVVNEEGRVTDAKAVSGHPLFRASAVAAAMKAGFAPAMLSGQPVRFTGTLTYEFSPPAN